MTITLILVSILLAAALGGLAFYHYRLHFRCRQLRDDLAHAAREHSRAWGVVDENQKRHTQLAEELAALRAARNVAWPRPAKRLAGGEVRRAFAVAAEAPLWMALNQELDDYLQDVLDQVSLPPGATMNAEARNHLAGGIEHLRLFHKRLLELHAAAQKLDTDIEGSAD
jgi:hypothetical protein